ncbi:unnamed protein product [Vitrella brassicaformis CCMP3155]|uniref:Thioredoxin domain-containing protein n=1 Tax=Vitrella brassicaformis (strain CCMP3155) TaxID=1169540 RepID=A0A0G4GMX4_VITBC|nr:unnamed protein product [Vitrella brassicaformis CCMP3155]|eukprot:CEM31547.1 unnamed protein product [Vitrella brassicaformis CCMP3155]
MVQFEIPDHGIVNDNKNSDAWSLLAYVPVPPFWQLDMENTAQVDSAHKNLGLPLHHFHHIVLLSCPFSHLLGHRGYPAIDRQKYQPVAAGLEAQNPILAEHSLAPRAGRQGLHRHRLTGEQEGGGEGSGGGCTCQGCSCGGCKCHHDETPSDLTEPGKEKGCQCKTGEKGCSCHHHHHHHDVTPSGLTEVGKENEIIHIADGPTLEAIKRDTPPSVLLVIDFMASWCVACDRIAPKLESLSHEYPAVTFGKVDVDNLAFNERPTDMLPTFHLIKGGKKLAEVKGSGRKGAEEAD